jgi:hypothetical protein
LRGFDGSMTASVNATLMATIQTSRLRLMLRPSLILG